MRTSEPGSDAAVVDRMMQKPISQRLSQGMADPQTCRLEFSRSNYYYKAQLVVLEVKNPVGSTVFRTLLMNSLSLKRPHTSWD